MSTKFSRLAETAGKGGLTLVAGNASSTLINAIAVLIIARLLGPSGYGLYTVMLAVPSIVVALEDLGISSALTRYTAKLRVEDPDSHLSLILKLGLTFKLILSTAAFLVILASSSFLASSVIARPGADGFLRLVSTLVLVQGVLISISAILIGLWRMSEASILNILQSIVKGLLSPVFIIVGLGVFGALLGHVSSFLAAATLGLVFFFNSYRGLTARTGASAGRRSKRPILLMMLGYGLPLYLASLMVMILQPYQNIVLARFVPDAEIGNLNASINFATAVNLIFLMPITTVLFPAFSELNPVQEIDGLRRVFRLSVKYASLLIVPISVLVMILSKELVYTIYGPRYTSAGFYLSVYVGLFLLTGLGYQILNSLFSGIGDTKETLKIAGVTAMIFIPMAPLMANAFQVLGVIVTVFFSAMVGTVYGLIRSRKKYRLGLHVRSLVSIYAASALSSIPVFIITQVVRSQSIVILVMAAFLYLLTYITAIPLFGALDHIDIVNLGRVTRGVKPVNALIRFILRYEDYLIRSRKRLTFKPLTV